MTDDKPSTLLEKFLGLMGILLGIGLTTILMMMTIVPLSQQAKTWLKTGVIPPKDLYWYTADVKCAATNWQAKGWEGMDLCRPNYIHFTDWVGVDRIINFVFDLHVAVIAIVILAAAWWLLIATIEWWHSRNSRSGL